MTTTNTASREVGGRGHDVIVVGARCAGAATAMLLARQGFDVLVVDRASFPSDTLSTHAIARSGVVQLARWGLLDAVVASGAPRIRTATFHYGDSPALAMAIKDRAGVDHLLAPRRHVLDTIVLSAAVDAGVSFESGVSVTGAITDSDGRVVGVAARDADGSPREFRAAVVVGADGVHSRIARSVGARVLDARPTDNAAYYSYAAGLDLDGFEFYVGASGFAGIFPTHGGEANVWISAPANAAMFGTGDRAGEFLALLARTSPRLGDRLRGATLTSPVRGAARLPNRVLEAVGPGWALVGDAGYHRDPITGHGISDAFRDAELLALQLGRALRGESPEEAALATYADDRYRALTPIFDVTSRLAEFRPMNEFIELVKEWNAVVDAEAAWLAALPNLPAAEPAAA